jgi:hypothetical protein
MCVFIRSKIIICLLSGATRSIQSLKPSNSQKHQEEGFQATQKRKEKKRRLNQSRANQKINKSNAQLHNLLVVHLQVSVVHTLPVTVSNSIYKLLKIPPRFIFGKSSLMNLYIRPSTSRSNTKILH